MSHTHTTKSEHNLRTKLRLKSWCIPMPCGTWTGYEAIKIWHYMYKLLCFHLYSDELHVVSNIDKWVMLFYHVSHLLHYMHRCIAQYITCSWCVFSWDLQQNSGKKKACKVFSITPVHDKQNTLPSSTEHVYPSNITVTLQWHHSDITMTSQWHSMTSQWHYNDITMTLQWHYNDITMTLQ